MAGNVTYAACLFGIIVVLAKMRDEATLGRWSLAVAIATPVSLLAGLNARFLQACDTGWEFRFGDYLGLRIVLVAVGILIVSAIALVSDSAESIRVLLVLVGAAKGCESLCDVFYGELERHEGMRFVATSTMRKGILSLLAFSVGVVLGGLEAGAAGVALAWAIVMINYDLPLIRAMSAISFDRNLGPRFDRAILSRLFIRALPLGIAIFLVSLTTSVPRLFLRSERDFAELGVFAALAYLTIPGTLIVNALGQSMTPRLAWLFAAGDRPAFALLLGKMSMVGLGLGVVGIAIAFALGGPVLRLLFKPEYAAHTVLLDWLMAAAGLGYVGSILGYGLTAARVHRGQVGLFAAACGATVLGCWMWIGPFGLIGATWGMMLGSGVQIVGAAALLVVAMRKAQG